MKIPFASFHNSTGGKSVSWKDKMREPRKDQRKFFNHLQTQSEKVESAISYLFFDGWRFYCSQHYEGKVAKLLVTLDQGGLMTLTLNSNMGAEFLSNKQSSGHQLGVLQFNSILTLSTQRQHYIPQFKAPSHQPARPLPISDSRHKSRLTPGLLTD